MDTLTLQYPRQRGRGQTGEGGWTAGTTWADTDTASVEVDDTTAELSIPLSSFANNPSEIRLFYVGKNAAFGGDVKDMYPDNALVNDANKRYFSYLIN